MIALYGDAITSERCDRAYLHAFSLAFWLGDKQYRFTQLPREGEFFVDESFAVAMEEWSTPWLLAWPLLSGK